jgi:hypothetical protein
MAVLLKLVWLAMAVFFVSLTQSYLWVNFEAALGRYGGDCAGRGICGFGTATGSYNSRLAYSKKDSVLHLQLLHDRFGRNELQQRLNVPLSSHKTYIEGFFVMEADCPLSTELKQRLHIPQGLQHIPAGQYKMTTANQQTMVSFKLQ